jgi:hypothetical protein
MRNSSGSSVNSTKINDQKNSLNDKSSFEKKILHDNSKNTSEPQARVGQPVSARPMEVSNTLSDGTHR